MEERLMTIRSARAGPVVLRTAPSKRASPKESITTTVTGIEGPRVALMCEFAGIRRRTEAELTSRPARSAALAAGKKATAAMMKDRKSILWNPLMQMWLKYIYSKSQ